MNNIQPISLPRLKNGQHHNFMRQVNERLATLAQVVDTLPRQARALDEAYRREDRAIVQSKKSFHTDTISENDKKRDAAYNALAAVVKAWKLATDAAVDGIDQNEALAVKRLAQLIKDYKIDTRAQLDQETGLLNNILDDLHTTHYEHIAALGLGNIVQAIDLHNSALKAATEDRLDENAGKIAGELKAARLKCDEAYTTLVDDINAYLRIGSENTQAALLPFAQYVDNLVAHYKQQALNQAADEPIIAGGQENQENQENQEDEEPNNPSTPSTPSEPEEPDTPSTPSTQDDDPGTGGFMG